MSRDMVNALTHFMLLALFRRDMATWILQSPYAVITVATVISAFNFDKQQASTHTNKYWPNLLIQLRTFNAHANVLIRKSMNLTTSWTNDYAEFRIRFVDACGGPRAACST